MKFNAWYPRRGLLGVASGIRPNKPERKSGSRNTFRPSAGDFHARHCNFQYLWFLVETRQKCVDFMVNFYGLYSRNRRATGGVGRV
jgi:hypothetical protein